MRVTLARTFEMFGWRGWNHVQSFAIENLFPEYVLNDDDKHGPSTISEEDADDEEKKGPSESGPVTDSQRGREKITCVRKLGLYRLHHTVGREILSPSIFMSCARSHGWIAASTHFRAACVANLLAARLMSFWTRVGPRRNTFSCVVTGCTTTMVILSNLHTPPPG